MWLLFVFSCAYQAVTSTLAALAWTRMRKAETDALRSAEEHALRIEELGVIKGQAASRESQLLQCQTTLGVLQQTIAAKSKELGALGEHCTQLESELRRQTAQAEEKQSGEQQSREASAKQASELAELIAKHATELGARDAALQGLRTELEAKDGELATSHALCAELEERCNASRNVTAESQARASNAEQELQDCNATIERLRAEAETQIAEVAAWTARCTELEQRESAAREAVEEQRARAGKADLKLAELETTLERLQADMSERETRLATISERCKALEQEAQCEDASRQERSQQEQALAAELTARASGLEALLAISGNRLLEQETVIARLNGEASMREARAETLGARCGELEQELQREAQEREARLQREQAAERALVERAILLEKCCEDRMEELRERAATFESLENATAAKRAELEAAGQRIGELERWLLETKAREQECALLEAAERAGLSARIEELEVRVSDGLVELHREFDTTANLLRALQSIDLELEAARLRGAALGEELRARTDEQRSLAAAHCARTLELEGEISGCKLQIRALQDECADLAERFRTASDSKRQRDRDVEERDRRIVELDASLTALEITVRASDLQICADDELLGDLLEKRVAARFSTHGALRLEPLPELYLEGMAQGDLALALQGLLGDVDQPLSAVSVARLATRWRDEHAAWKQRPLECDVAYLWAEGIPLEVEAESPDLSVLVVAAAFVDGSRGLVSVETGERGSKESWLGVLRDLARRGMQVAPRIVVADGKLGIWDALDELGIECARQHCWNSKTTEVLGLLPKGRRAEASKILRAI
ncbi:MAG TPA: transposase, partial [Planctomycetota bacterium]|nr:transposase [Planctomycetota bacterium]